MRRILSTKSDSIGVIAGSLCLIHCAITPLIFVAQACTKTCCASTPDWWSWIDFIFIGVAFFAVYRSVKTTGKNWMKYALWTSWGTLFLLIINEQTGLIAIPELSVQIAALILVGLHLYNLKYCLCEGELCSSKV